MTSTRKRCITTEAIATKVSDMENDEVKHLFHSLDKSYFPEYRDYIAIMLMLDSGTRLGETLSIEIEQATPASAGLF